MKKEGKESTTAKAIKTGISAVSDVLFSQVFSRLNNATQNLMDTVKSNMMQLQERMAEKLFSSLLIGLGIISLVVAIFFYLREYVAVTKTQAFFGVGIILLLIGYVLKYLSLKKERGA